MLLWRAVKKPVVAVTMSRFRMVWALRKVVGGIKHIISGSIRARVLLLLSLLLRLILHGELDIQSIRSILGQSVFGWPSVSFGRRRLILIVRPWMPWRRWRLWAAVRGRRRCKISFIRWVWWIWTIHGRRGHFRSSFKLSKLPFRPAIAFIDLINRIGPWEDKVGLYISMYHFISLFSPSPLFFLFIFVLACVCVGARNMCKVTQAHRLDDYWLAIWGPIPKKITNQCNFTTLYIPASRRLKSRNSHQPRLTAHRRHLQPDMVSPQQSKRKHGARKRCMECRLTQRKRCWKKKKY